ncbi:MAG: MFS transporter [Candidatus Bathyarchaeota archaeon]|nr:MFS transporter [Candidatus Bathyarchaeota archaeon]
MRVKKIISTKAILSLTYGRFMFAITSAVITTRARNELNIDSSILALFFTLRGLANTCGRLPTGRLSDWIGRKKPLISSFILFAVIFFLLSEIQHTALISLLIFLYGMAHGIRAVSEWSFLGDIVSRKNRSLANFYFSSVFDFGMAIGATFAGTAALILLTQDILKITALLVGSGVVVIGRLQEPSRQK